MEWKPVVEEGARHDSMISFIGLLIQRGGQGEIIKETAWRSNANFCRPPIEDGEMTTMLDSAINSWTPEEACNQALSDLLNII